MNLATRSTCAAVVAAVVALLGAAIASPLQATPASPAQAASLAAPSTSGAQSAALRRAAEQCAAGEICFWRERNYSGIPWRWRPVNGYRNLPANLHDHVYSFYANARGCFIDWGAPEFRTVEIGDYAKAYDTNFGRRIDAVNQHGECHP